MLHILEKLFLGINNTVTHGPFNLTFSFLSYCTSLLFLSISVLKSQLPTPKGKTNEYAVLPHLYFCGSN